MVGKKMANRRHRIKIGALVLISTMLFGSAFLRLRVEAGPVVSRNTERETDSSAVLQVVAPLRYSHLGDLGPILVEFQIREEKIAIQEAKILDKTKALLISEAALVEKLRELVRAETKLRASLALADGATDRDLAQLTDVYEKMKPKDASVLFEKMDPKFAAGFLARMKPGVAAGILSGINPDSAYRISLIFAGRNSNVPKK